MRSLRLRGLGKVTVCGAMKRITLLLFALPLLTFVLRAAEPLKVGDKLPAFETKDQHEKPFTFQDGAYRLFLVSFTMGSGKDVNGWLAKKEPGFLDSKKALFLADIHGMPGVGRVFALPKMKKYPHRILLGDDDKLLERYPRQEDRITVFDLDENGVITGIRFIDPEKELPALFGS